jgi:hypothetical protein
MGYANGIWRNIMKVSKNGIDVEVPIGLPTDGNVKGGYQVFLQEDTKQIDKHVEALTHLPKYIWEGWTRILHPFAGLGVTAQVLDKGTGRKLKHHMWERDAECCAYLRKMGHVVTQVEDSYKILPVHDLHGFDAVMFDPTAGTIKTPGMLGFWERAATCRLPLVWVTDSACSKIWLHKDHYRLEFGRRVEDAEDYLRAYNDFLKGFGYNIVEAMREPTVTYFVAVREMNVPSFDHIIRL